MPPPRILHVIHSLGCGGVETWLMHMLHTVPRTTAVLDIACRSHCPVSREEGVRHLGAKVFTDMWRGGPYLYYRRLRGLIRRERYDIVHSHVPTTCGVDALAADAEGARLIWTSHATSPEAGSRFAGGPTLLTTVRRYLIGINLRRMVRSAQLITGVSRATLEPLAAYGAALDRCRILRLGVVTPPPLPSERRSALRRKMGASDEMPVILHVGRFTPEKNHAGLLRIFSMVAACHPKARLVMVGEGALYAEVSSLVSQSPHAGRITMLGQRADVCDLMGAADLLVFPSLAEGFGMVAIEAAVSGLPTIASDIPGLNEVIVDGVTGLLRPPADEAGMAAAVCSLLGDPEKVASLRAAACERARDFSSARSADALLSLYQHMLLS